MNLHRIQNCLKEVSTNQESLAIRISINDQFEAESIPRFISYSSHDSHTSRAQNDLHCSFFCNVQWDASVLQVSLWRSSCDKPDKATGLGPERSANHIYLNTTETQRHVSHSNGHAMNTFDTWSQDAIGRPLKCIPSLLLRDRKPHFMSIKRISASSSGMQPLLPESTHTDVVCHAYCMLSICACEGIVDTVIELLKFCCMVSTLKAHRYIPPEMCSNEPKY